MHSCDHHPGAHNHCCGHHHAPPHDYCKPHHHARWEFLHIRICLALWSGLVLSRLAGSRVSGLVMPASHMPSNSLVGMRLRPVLMHSCDNHPGAHNYRCGHYHAPAHDYCRPHHDAWWGLLCYTH